MPNRFSNFHDFYPYYLSEHRQPACKLLHFLGSSAVLATALAAIFFRHWWTLALLPLVGYGPAWIGHFFFEKNRPATFRYPLYSFLGDWVMYADILRGRIPLWGKD